MTKEQIIQYSVSILIIPVVNLIFRRYIEPIMPEAKKLISYTKKFLVFTVLYVFPVAVIIFTMATAKAVDKYFVLVIALYCGMFMFNFMGAIVMLHRKKLSDFTRFSMFHFRKLDSRSGRSLATIHELTGFADDQYAFNKKLQQRINALEQKIASLENNNPGI